MVDGLVFFRTLFSEKQSFCGLSNSEVSEQFRRFVSLDELDSKLEKVLEHDLIARHFESTFSIDERTNRFVIRLSLKETVMVLKGSFGKACAILLNSERRRSEIVSKAYTNIFNEYLSLGHMTKISRKLDEFAYYMPHHIVSKGSNGISHRMVFNALFEDDSGTSLNSCFLEGPSLQPNLVVNMICFRSHLLQTFFVCIGAY